MAYDPSKFGYAVLANRAAEQDLLPNLARVMMEHLGTSDFEKVMRTLSSAAETLRVIDPEQPLVQQLSEAVDELREALAKSIAGLHPERPYEISEKQYLSTREFLDRFGSIYTVNYDLLLYWSLMQNFPPDHLAKGQDDGFRDSGITGDNTVLWNIYSPHTQSIHYLHGALHLFLGEDGLRKITWIRTADALIDQARRQLEADRYPLYVAEGGSSEKLDKINRSAYLSKALRSLTACGGALTIYGHSLDANDEHVLQAIVRSKISQIAISLYGDPKSAANREIIQRAELLRVKRSQMPGGERRPLTVDFFDAGSVGLWAE